MSDKIFALKRTLCLLSVLCLVIAAKAGTVYVNTNTNVSDQVFRHVGDDRLFYISASAKVTIRDCLFTGVDKFGDRKRAGSTMITVTDSARLVVSNCVFDSITIDSSYFNDCVISVLGSDAELVLIDCTFRNCSLPNANKDGAVVSVGNNAHFLNCVFTGNQISENASPDVSVGSVVLVHCPTSDGRVSFVNSVIAQNLIYSSGTSKGYAFVLRPNTGLLSVECLFRAINSAVVGNYPDDSFIDAAFDGRCTFESCYSGSCIGPRFGNSDVLITDVLDDVKTKTVKSGEDFEINHSYFEPYGLARFDGKKVFRNETFTEFSTGQAEGFLPVVRNQLGLRNRTHADSGGVVYYGVGSASMNTTQDRIDELVSGETLTLDADEGPYDDFVIPASVDNITIRSDNGAEIRGRGPSRVRGVTVSTEGVRLEGLFFRDWDVRDSGVCGGAVGADHPTYVHDCLFINCSSYGSGGAVSGKTILDGCGFSSCSSCCDKGGAAFEPVSVSNCVFTGCSATNSIGGAIGFGTSNNYVVVGSTFTDCRSKLYGGAISSGFGSISISGCKFTGCRSDNGGAVDWSSEIYDSSNTVKISSCDFTANYALEDGGAVFLKRIDGEIEDCVFRENAADGFGGAVCVGDDKSKCIIRNSSLFYSNYASTGGAVYNPYAVLECEFDGNSAEWGGAGCFSDSCNGAERLLYYCGFENNEAMWEGGAICNCKAVVTNCMFTGNRSSRGGGGAICRVYETVADSWFNSNYSDDSGGAVYVGSPGASIVRCRFAGNSSQSSGGAVFGAEHDGLSTDKSVIESSYFVGNTAVEKGGAVSRCALVRHCSFAGNASSSGECQATCNTKVALSLSYANGFDTNAVVDAFSKVITGRDPFVDSKNGNLRLSLADEHTDIRIWDSAVINGAIADGWRDYDKMAFVTRLADAYWYYPGAYAHVGEKQPIVNGTNDTYPDSNIRTSLREAIGYLAKHPEKAVDNKLTVEFDPTVFDPGFHDIFLEQAQIEIPANTFVENQLVIAAPTGTVRFLGHNEFRAIRIGAGNRVRIENVHFEDCYGSPYGASPQPGFDGGAILNEGDLELSGCVFRRCHGGNAEINPFNVPPPEGFGGAVANKKEGRLVATGCYFEGNIAARGGAVYNGNSGMVTLVSSLFVTNAAVEGASVYTFAGGAVASVGVDTDCLIVNCTMAGNAAEDIGGAVYCEGDGDVPNLHILNSILLGNETRDGVEDVRMFGGAAQMAYTIYGTRKETGFPKAVWSVDTQNKPDRIPTDVFSNFQGGDYALPEGFVMEGAYIRHTEDWSQVGYGTNEGLSNGGLIRGTSIRQVRSKGTILDEDIEGIPSDPWVGAFVTRSKRKDPIPPVNPLVITEPTEEALRTALEYASSHPMFAEDGVVKVSFDESITGSVIQISSPIDLWSGFSSVALELTGPIVLKPEGDNRLFEIGPASDVRFRQIDFLNGWDTEAGGAILGENCSLDCVDCRFYNNNAFSMQGDTTYGGAICLDGLSSYANFVRCDFDGNYADYGPDIYTERKDRLFFTDCNIDTNQFLDCVIQEVPDGLEVWGYGNVLQEAIDRANPGDTIHVKYGNFLPVTVPSTKGNLTIVGLDYYSCHIDGKDADRCFTDNSPGTVRLSNFTLRNGDVFGEPGGGAYASAGTLILSNCCVRYCKTSVNGGAFTVAAGARGEAYECRFISNTADQMGGGTYDIELIDRCRYYTNRAGNSGGGFYGSRSSRVVGSVFAENNAGLVGGGLYTSAALKLLNSTFADNTSARCSVYYMESPGLISCYGNIFYSFAEDSENSMFDVPGGQRPNIGTESGNMLALKRVELFVDPSDRDYRVDALSWPTVLSGDSVCKEHLSANSSKLIDGSSPFKVCAGDEFAVSGAFPPVLNLDSRLQQLINDTPPGGTVVLADGEYGPATVPEGKGSLSFVHQGSADRCVIDGLGTFGALGSQNGVREISGITFKNCFSRNSGIIPSVEKLSRCRFIGCESKNNDIVHASDSTIICGCLFYRNFPSASRGVVCVDAEATLVSCTFSHNSGFDFVKGESNDQQVDLVNNVFYKPDAASVTDVLRVDSSDNNWNSYVFLDVSENPFVNAGGGDFNLTDDLVQVVYSTDTNLVGYVASVLPVALNDRNSVSRCNYIGIGSTGFVVPGAYPTADIDVDLSSDALCFTANTDGSWVSLHIAEYLDIRPVIEYIDSSTCIWTPYVSQSNIYLNAGQRVYFRAATDGVQIITSAGTSLYTSCFRMGGSIAASGDVTRLLSRNGTDSVGNYGFCGLFKDCDALTSAPELPAVNLGNSCYESMFEGCASLTYAPALPAMNLAEYCYNSMFDDCVSLTNAPALPATNLAMSCYASMFSGCGSLAAAPDLPVTNLAMSCYKSMFSGCGSLTVAPDLPAMNLARTCYFGMFSGCSSLTVAPCLPATTLAPYCYSSMFDECSNLHEVSIAAVDNLDLADFMIWLDQVAPSGAIVCTDTLWEFLPKDNGSGVPPGWVQKKPVEPDALCFTANTDGSTIALHAATDILPKPVFEYYDPAMTSWHQYTDGTVVTLNAGQKVYFRAATNETQQLSNGSGDGEYTKFSMTGSIAASGDVTRLLNSEGTVSVGAYGLCGLFRGCAALTSAPKLPAVHLAEYCYNSMFYGCSSLVSAPALPATTLATACYENMFAYCRSLVSAPALPATALAPSCYRSMFSSCENLTPPPALPATTLAYACYEEMFSDCASLVSAPDLPAFLLVDHCYDRMFARCPLLESVSIAAMSGYGGDAMTDWLQNNTRSGVLSCSDELWDVIQKDSYSGIPPSWTHRSLSGSLRFKSLADGSWVSLYVASGFSPENIPRFEYFDSSTGSWTEYTSETVIHLDAGQSVSFRAATDVDQAISYEYMNTCRSCFSMGGNIDVSGDVTRLLNRNGTSTVGRYGFYELFKDCTSMRSAPDLPATELGELCCSHMFSGCTSLTSAPKISATKLAKQCCNFMFSGCSSLVSAPELPAMDLAESCYGNMFENCSNLVSVPVLPATNLATRCYNYMFYNCISLASAPALPATNLCYHCYASMFLGCKALTSAPELPARNLAKSCYESMFGNCSSLRLAPRLPAISLPQRCYNAMFEGCSSLNRVVIDALFKDLNAMVDWLKNVASSGEVECYDEFFLDNGSPSGIPSGWSRRGATAGLCFLSRSDYSKVNLITANIEPKPKIEYCLYGFTEWKPYVSNTEIELTSGETVLFRSATDVDQAISTSRDDYSQFFISGSVQAYGDATYLLRRGGSLNVGKYGFYNLFKSCAGLTSAPRLKADILSANCYDHMFCDCTSLIAPPELPATEVAACCYYSMFAGCSQLVSAPELRATEMATECYENMFQNCIRLVTPPELPAMKLAPYCYGSMFKGCTTLCLAPDLPAESLEMGCYSGMFEGCISLVASPDLLAIKLANACYESMFKGCSGLNKVWAYPYFGLDSIKATENWLSGVSAQGTIMCSDDFYNAVAKDSGSGIPAGWTCRAMTPLCFTANENNSSVSLNIESSVKLRYFTSSGQVEKNYSGGQIIDLDKNEKVYFRAASAEDQKLSPGADSPSFSMYGSIAASGNVTTLLNLKGTDVVPKPGFKKLFYNCRALTTAPELPATTLSDDCCYEMFYNCSKLTAAPELPATTIGASCYCGMFSGCSSLKTPPRSLPAVNLEPFCYSRMFSGCKSLTTTPFLPATVLKKGCYRSMFDQCESLVSPPQLPAMTLAESCYEDMFDYCTGLLRAPRLPATTLADYCYRKMFYNCTSLIWTPELPATTLARGCCTFMFYNCASLIAASRLPATTLVDDCYYGMFSGCGKLCDIAIAATALGGARTPMSNCFSGVDGIGVIKCPDSLFAEIQAQEIVPADWLHWQYEDDALCFFAESDSKLFFERDHDDYEAPSFEYMVLGSGSTAWSKVHKSQDGKMVSQSFDLSAGQIVCFRTDSTGIQHLDTITTGENLKITISEGSVYGFGDLTRLLKRAGSTGCCYSRVFKEIFSFSYGLKSFKSLPPFADETGCYDSLFADCYNMIVPPELPATSLAAGCYGSIFSGCRNLRVAPELPAAYLKSGCYAYMFQNCENLREVVLSATDSEWFTSLRDWLAGVAPSGVIKCTDEFYEEFMDDPDVIPAGWTRMQASGPMSFGVMKSSGVMQSFDTVTAAAASLGPGDKVMIIDDEMPEPEAVDAQAFLMAVAEAIVADKDWCSIGHTDEGAISIELNEKATPDLGDESEIDLTSDSDEVSIKPANVKPYLYYGIGRADSPAGPYVVEADGWVQADADGTLPQALTAPKTGAEGYYRVEVRTSAP